MAWVKDIITGLYDVYKKNTNSRAQKRARKEAEAEVYARLLSNGVLMDLVSQLERYQIEYLDHLKQYHTPTPKRAGDDDIIGDEEDIPPPPPLPESMTELSIAERAPTVQERQQQILAALRSR